MEMEIMAPEDEESPESKAVWGLKNPPSKQIFFTPQLKEGPDLGHRYFLSVSTFRLKFSLS